MQKRNQLIPMKYQICILIRVTLHPHFQITQSIAMIRHNFRNSEFRQKLPHFTDFEPNRTSCKNLSIYPQNQKMNPKSRNMFSSDRDFHTPNSFRKSIYLYTKTKTVT